MVFMTSEDLIMLGIVMFSSIFVFLFNYRQDNKDKYQGNYFLVAFDCFINLGMSATGYLLISIMLDNIPQLAPYQTFKYPVGYLFGLTSNVSIPIVLQYFQQEMQKRLKDLNKKSK